MKKSYDFSNAKRGAVVPTPTGRTRITNRIDDDALEWFRKRVHEGVGGNYQTMMNQALRAHIEREEEALEETLRRVLKEVLPGFRTRPRKAAKKNARKKARRRQSRVAAQRIGVQRRGIAPPGSADAREVDARAALP